ncbi:MAG: HEAT repeat domain-containing protein [Candidatus Parabeggiatoa sp.]|nr:HEAT repeat domain-containing protein [Candidatus Parabeggiatoa sp.]
MCSQPHLNLIITAENERVRAAAYDALRHIEAPRAVEMLTTHYEIEKSPAVRDAAAKTLSKMTPSEAGITWAGQTVLTTDAPKEQIPLVEMLGKTLETYPENETHLRELLKNNPNNKVKREVYKYLVPIH